MNKKNNVGIGPGAATITLLVVMLSISVLGILSLMSSRTDAGLTTRSADVVRAVYDLNNRAEEDLAALDAILKECSDGVSTDEQYMQNVRSAITAPYELADREICWTETDDQRTLELTAEIQPFGEAARLRLTGHILSSATEEIWD